MSKLVIAATDGSAINNPNGPAGWAWFVSENCWAAGGFNKASNQVAELFAVLALLRSVPREYDLLVRTDSQFTINVMTKWMAGWKRNDWKKSDGKPVANLPLIQDLDRAMSGRNIRFEWVKGHSGDRMNEIADALCGDASNCLRLGREDKIKRGPGWTGFEESPVIPGASATRQPARPARAQLVGERISQQDLIDQGYGANARVKRVVAPPAPRTQVRMDICTSCDGAINPLTLNCRCGSL